MREPSLFSIMKSSNSKTDPDKLTGNAKAARQRVALAESKLKSAKEQAGLAKRRRKEAKLVARRAKQQVKRAKAELAEAKKVLGESEQELALAAKRADEARKRIKPRQGAKTPVNKPKKTNRSARRRPTALVVSPGASAAIEEAPFAGGLAETTGQETGSESPGNAGSPSTQENS